ncbi:10293_t:CDS:2 [Acaulospora colombiana]|uniref:10293_t:CDS:1 n=1 Tax=Acaulospora colombiana TaxID=27376 RepID=A0ACA9NNZ3_9GLOM|nr:10293_t:CDS:2 [Acaulospora colombiana]
MGLLTIIRKNRRKERQMRILFLGLDNAGKTTILKKLNNEDVYSVSPTLGFNIKTFVHGKNYFEQTDALVWVVDSSDRMRMGDCKKELHDLLQEERLSGASLLVFANKHDIQGSLTEGEIRDALDLRSIKTHNWKICSCSAITGENLFVGLDWAVTDVAGRLYYSTVA